MSGFNGVAGGEGGLARPTTTLHVGRETVQIITLPHGNTVAVVDFGPVMHRVAETGVPSRDWTHNLFREGIDEFAEQQHLSRDAAVRRLVELALTDRGLPTAEWIAANP